MNGNPRFQKLLEPGRIGQLELRNRIVMSPMGTNFAAEGGFITDRIKDYYEERARGGVGLIIVGVGAIDHPRGRVMPCQVGISDDKFIPGLAELAQAVHRHGAKVAIQLQHGGKLSTEDLAEGYEPVTPSAAPIPMGEVLQDMTSAEVAQLMQRFAKMPTSMMTREITLEEIAQVVQRFAQAAECAQKAGLDGVEIHAGHGYLVAAFLSRESNKRQDAYGGDLKNRARLLLEIIKAVREKVGATYPVWCRLDGQEFGIEEGITPQEAQEVARMVEEAGVDAIHVSGYGGPVGGFYEAPLVYPPGNLVPLAQGIKQVVNIPVIAVGRISPELGERVLRQGQADLIAMGRPLLADPELPNKLASGKLEDVRPCIYCYSCVDQIFRAESVYCTVNAATGKEGEFTLEPAERANKILVVGGGPAGMEAARVAALRGHQVMLYEKGHRLGGSLVFAPIVQRDNEDFLNYLVTQIRKLPIKVKLGEEVTPALIEDIKPDVAILALGGSLVAPQIPGVDRHNVISGAELRQMISGRLKRFLKPSAVRWLTRFWMPLRKRITIIGGDLVGCELAEFLVERGRKVTILESRQEMAAEMSIPNRWRLMPRLRQGGVTMLTGVNYEEITPKGVIITTQEGERQTIEADTVVLAGGMEPNVALSQAIEGKVPQIYLVGDCTELRLIRGAIADGARVALTI